MTRALALVIVGLLGGCVRLLDMEDPQMVGPGSGSTPTARELFEADVYPILVQRCGGCHALGGATSTFVDPTPARAYETITSSPVVDAYEEAAPITMASLGSTGHQGFIAYTNEERTAILGWLAKEREERGL